MSEISVGNYILARLKQLSISHLFGLPGDFNLTFLDLVEDDTDITWVGCCNEMNAAMAAEGFARVSQGIGALLTTYGVGDLTALNGIANAYSESVPICHIVGSPPSKFVQQQDRVVHHTLADGRADAFLNISKIVTAAQVRLDADNLSTAASEIDRVLRACVVQSRPVYIDIPTDVVNAKISAESLQQPLTLNSIRKSLSEPGDHQKLIQHVVKRITELLQQAKQPFVIIDMYAVRFNVLPLVLRLVEETKIPFVTTPLAKCALPEDHPLFRGVYGGKVSDPAVYEFVQSRDIGLSIGRIRSDLNTGAFSHTLDREVEIEFNSNSIIVQYARYDQLNFFNLLPALIEALRPIKFPQPTEVVPGCGLSAFDGKVEHSSKLTQAFMWPMMANMLRANDVVLAEVGNSHFGLLGSKLPAVSFHTASIWCSIGWGLASLMGAATAARKTGRRTILFTGEGSAQETLQDIGTMIRNGLTPIIFLINNSGYTIERLIHGETRVYNDVAAFNWQKTLDFFGGDASNSATYRIATEGDLVDLLHSEKFLKADKIQLVELIMDKMDGAPLLKKQLGLVKSASK